MKKTIISAPLFVLLLLGLTLFNPGYGYAASAAPAGEKPVVKALSQGLLTRAKEGGAEAQALLGYKYYKGRGIPRDYSKALIWYEKAALQGLTKAQFSLGAMYANGHGVTRDYKEALRWYKKAAFQGYAEAQFSLGQMYYNGDGVPRDYVLSYMWLNLSSAGGLESARTKMNSLEAKMTAGQIEMAQKFSMEFTTR